MDDKTWRGLSEKSRERAKYAAGLQTTKKLSGPVRQLSREEIERLYGAHATQADTVEGRAEARRATWTPSRRAIR